MKVCIKGDGTDEYGKKIIEHLEGLGGVNKYLLKGNDLGKVNNGAYFIDNDCTIVMLSIPQGYKEISLKEVEHICYVGKKIVFPNGQTDLILSQRGTIMWFLDAERNWVHINISDLHRYKIID